MDPVDELSRQVAVALDKHFKDICDDVKKQDVMLKDLVKFFTEAVSNLSDRISVLEELNIKPDKMINEKDIENSSVSSNENKPEIEIEKVYINME